jgi:hypothetical protein
VIFPLVFHILYYAIPEGLCGASLGKAICNLRVLDRSRSVPGLARAFLRAVLFVAALDLPGTTIFFGSYQELEPFVMLICVLGLFATARKTNGWAGLHDLASKTRVVRQKATEARRANEKTEPTLPQIEGSANIGPYHVLSRLDETASYELLLGYDTRLLRKVWIYKERAGSPPRHPPPGSRRPTRLRRLNGRHTTEASWDAYEAPTGQALLQSLQTLNRWESVRYWLHDFAQELCPSPVISEAICNERANAASGQMNQPELLRLFFRDALSRGSAHDLRLTESTL